MTPLPDPVVSPADTIRRAREHAGYDSMPESLREPFLALCDLADALLAVGERDKAAIERRGSKVDGLRLVVADQKRTVNALYDERERNRQQIARLTEFVSAYDNLDDALDNLLDYLKLIGWSEQEDRNVKAALKWAQQVSGYFGRCNSLRAVLAGEEDAANG